MEESFLNKSIIRCQALAMLQGENLKLDKLLLRQEFMMN